MMSEIDLQFFFLILSLSSFYGKVILASQNCKWCFLILQKMDVYMMKGIYSSYVGQHLAAKLSLKCLWVYDSNFLIENSGFLFLLRSVWIYYGVFCFFLQEIVHSMFLNLLSQNYFYSFFNSCCEYFCKQYFHQAVSYQYFSPEVS